MIDQPKLPESDRSESEQINTQEALSAINELLVSEPKYLPFDGEPDLTQLEIELLQEFFAMDISFKQSPRVTRDELLAALRKIAHRVRTDSRSGNIARTVMTEIQSQDAKKND